MSSVTISREAILATSRELIIENGWSAVNMRSVASACGVAVGSIYNYFGSKNELLVATAASVWREIFHPPGQNDHFSSFLDCVEWLWRRLAAGVSRYPGFVTLHSMSFVGEDREQGRRMMRQSWEHIEQGLSQVLAADQQVRPDAFDERLTRASFIRLIFSLLVASLLREEDDVEPILELVRRTIY